MCNNNPFFPFSCFLISPPPPPADPWHWALAGSWHRRLFGTSQWPPVCFVAEPPLGARDGSFRTRLVLSLHHLKLNLCIIFLSRLSLSLFGYSSLPFCGLSDIRFYFPCFSLTKCDFPLSFYHIPWFFSLYADLFSTPTELRKTPQAVPSTSPSVPFPLAVLSWRAYEAPLSVLIVLSPQLRCLLFRPFSLRHAIFTRFIAFACTPPYVGKCGLLCTLPCQF